MLRLNGEVTFQEDIWNMVSPNMFAGSILDLEEGTREEPSFTGLMCAYNYRCGAGDTAPGGRPRVKPGDIVMMHAGTYAYCYEF